MHFHEHYRLSGGPFDGQVKSMALLEHPPTRVQYASGMLPDGQVVYPAPLPGGPFEKVRYRVVVVVYMLVRANYHQDNGAVESWPHRDEQGMLLYEYEGTTVP